MGSPLKRAREAAGLTIADVERATRLSPRILAAIDDERYDRLAAGLYARTAVRAYARAVGLDPTAVLADLQRHLPDAPLDLAAVADLRTPPHRGHSLRYLAAALVDASVLLAIVSTIVAFFGRVCGLAPRVLVEAAPLPILLLCATPAALYFWLLGATGVGTLGAWLLDVEILPTLDGPMSLDSWLRRGIQYAIREAALAVDATCRPNCYGPASTRE